MWAAEWTLKQDKHWLIAKYNVSDRDFVCIPFCGLCWTNNDEHLIWPCEVHHRYCTLFGGRILLTFAARSQTIPKLGIASNLLQNLGHILRHQKWTTKNGFSLNRTLS